MALEAFAIFASYLVFSLSLASATSVNIMYNGQVQDTAKYENENLVNMQINMKHEPSDITWTNIKLVVNLNSATLAQSIKRIFLYKCRSATPTECVRSEPQVFDNYVDSELLWKDISEQTGSAQYPQIANLLFIVKLEDMAGKENWVGFFTKTKRTSYNIFDTTQLGLSEMDVYARSADLVEPIKYYIENKVMIPFKWVTKVVFHDSTRLYGMGANSPEMDSHQFQTAVSSANEITSVNKDFYLVAPEISSGIANPITLNLNPSFSCGSGTCESDIGESSATCCYDCGCPAGQFCDVPANINMSRCKNETVMNLAIVSANTPLITDCSQGFNANISVRIDNPPASLVSQISGTVKLNEAIYNVVCSGISGYYSCSVLLGSEIKCGGGSFVLGPGLLNLSITYNDGPNQVSKLLSTAFSGISVNYDCKCQGGSYCDTLKKTCQPESAVTLGITALTSYLDNYQEGDKIYLSAKIFNPPAGLVLVDKSATLNLTNGQVFPGTPECSNPSPQYEYNCSIPFQISGYSKTQAYTFQPNVLFFTITYNDGPVAKTRTISAPFGPISVPSQDCGNGRCNPGEDSEKCCLDCGCPDAVNQYCDSVNGCRRLDSIGLSVTSAYPANFTDCKQSHTSFISASVQNAPTGLTLDYFTYLQSGAVKGWNFNCQKLAISIFNCTLVIPSLESEGCSLPYKIVGPNSINMSVSFPDGKSKQLTKTISAPFENILVIPVYHCGDGKCESTLNENASNCCYDCACKDDTKFGDSYYCDFDSKTYLGGCLPKSNITVVIDSPKAPVQFDSCEINNEVNIKAHIQNQPLNGRIETYYATLNGSAADMLNCYTVELFPGSSNFSLNCSLTVSSVYGCTRGETYKFDPNSFSVLMSYKNGNLKNEVQTLTAKLPKIEIRQGVRTLYDIMQDGLDKMTKVMKKTMNTAKALLSEIKNCMNTIKMMAYITLISSIVLGVVSGIQGQSATPGYRGLIQNKVQVGVSTAASVAQLGTSMIQAYGAFCSYLQTQYNIDMEMQKIEVQMIQMQMCMEIYQHQMDIGQCNQNAQGCFSSMQSCITTMQSAMSSWTNNINSILTQGNNYLTTMSTAIKNAGTNGWGGYYNNPYVDFLTVTCGGTGGTSVSSCCDMAVGTLATTNTAGRCADKYAYLHVQPSGSACSYPVVWDALGDKVICGSPAAPCSSSFNMGYAPTAEGEVKYYKLYLFCFSSQDEFVKSNPNFQSLHYVGNPKDFAYGHAKPLVAGSPASCTCPKITESTKGCCVEKDKTCTEKTETVCKNSGGTYATTSCTTVQGCSQYTGVTGCCALYKDDFGNSFCTDDVIQGDCKSLNGTFTEGKKCSELAGYSSQCEGKTITAPGGGAATGTSGLTGCCLIYGTDGKVSGCQNVIEENCNAADIAFNANQICDESTAKCVNKDQVQGTEGKSYYTIGFEIGEGAAKAEMKELWQTTNLPEGEMLLYQVVTYVKEDVIGDSTRENDFSAGFAVGWDKTYPKKMGQEVSKIVIDAAKSNKYVYGEEIGKKHQEGILTDDVYVRSIIQNNVYPVVDYASALAFHAGYVNGYDANGIGGAAMYNALASYVVPSGGA